MRRLPVTAIVSALLCAALIDWISDDVTSVHWVTVWTFVLGIAFGAVLARRE